MSDPPGIPSALGIEAVEWQPQPGGSLTVSVIGRWRRRRPSWSGQPQLVIEAQGMRNRFPAMPEPPSLIGAAPGTWRLSFSVPASLAPHLGGRVWLQLGAVVVPLPAAAARPAPDPAELSPASEPAGPSPAPRSARERLPAPESPDRAVDLQVEVQRLDRRRRIAEQRAHAEHALRMELAEELAQLGSAGRSAHQLAAAEERIEQLEGEIGFLRRRLARRTVGQERAAIMRAELAAARKRDVAAPAALAPMPESPGGLLDAERRIVEWRARRQPSLLAPLVGLRTQLRVLRGEIEHEGALRADAERRVVEAYDAIAALRSQLGNVLDPAELSMPAETPAERDVEPELRSETKRLEAERFEVALARLREATPRREAESGEAAEPDGEGEPGPDGAAAQPDPDAEPRTWFGRLLRRLRKGAQSG